MEVQYRYIKREGERNLTVRLGQVKRRLRCGTSQVSESSTRWGTTNVETLQRCQ